MPLRTTIPLPPPDRLRARHWRRWALFSAAAALALGGCSRGAPEYVAPPPLTPPPPEHPRINGARVFGVRPGAPFHFAIPATGIRPMRFEADGLPDGLTLDPATGRITGRLPVPGEHRVELRAINARGSATRELRIVAGDKIALTPPMGWNSWNCWGADIDQDKILRAARAMVDSGLAQHGWTYINIDDGWQGERPPPTRALQPNAKFPDMAGLCQAIQALGLKAGIYSTPWVTSYARYPGGSGLDADGKWGGPPQQDVPRNVEQLPFHVGPHSFAGPDARQWADWGFDYLKYDWNPVRIPEVEEMAGALRATGRDIVYTLSNNGTRALAADYARFAQSWRTTGDIRDTWEIVESIGFAQDPWAPFAGPGHWNDPDMLVVGWVGWGTKQRRSRLTFDEQYSHMSLWCLLSGPLLIGCDLEKLDPFTLGLLTNDEVLAVNQDPLGRQAVRVAETATAAVFAKPMEDGSLAVGLFNREAAPATVRVGWGDLKIRGSQTVRDLWRQKDLGTFDEGFSADVAPHGVVLVRMMPVVPRER